MNTTPLCARCHTQYGECLLAPGLDCVPPTERPCHQTNSTRVKCLTTTWQHCSHFLAPFFLIFTHLNQPLQFTKTLPHRPSHSYGKYVCWLCTHRKLCSKSCKCLRQPARLLTHGAFCSKGRHRVVVTAMTRIKMEFQSAAANLPAPGTEDHPDDLPQ